MSRKKHNRLKLVPPPNVAAVSLPKPGENPFALAISMEAMTAAFLALLTFLVFQGALGNGEVNLDDSQAFLRHATKLHGFFEGLTAAWKGALTGSGAMTQPLAWYLIWLQLAIAGVAAVKIYHWVSILLHVSNSALLFLFTLRLTPPAKKGTSAVISAALAALLFAVHPLRTEAVAWTACQPLLWGVLFALLSTFAFWRSLDGKAGMTPWSLGFFVCALLCKPVIFVLPLLFPILARYHRRFLQDEAAAPSPAVSKLFWVSSAAGAFWTLLAFDWHLVASSSWKLLFEPFIFQTEFLFRTLFPFSLSAIYPLPGVFVIALSLIASGLLGHAAWRLSRRFTVVSYAFLAYAVLLIPGILMAICERVAFSDRYGYLPALVLSAAAGIGLQPVFDEERKTAWADSVSYAVLIGLAFLTLRLIPVWESSKTLWRHAISSAGARSGKANVLLSASFVEEKDFSRSREVLTNALALNDDVAEIYNGLGASYLLEGNLERAKESFEKAVEKDPGYAEALNNLGYSLNLLHRPADALKYIDSALLRIPWDPRAHENHALSMEKLGRMNEAAEDWGFVVTANPMDAEARNHFAADLAQSGDTARAAEEFRQAADLEPKKPAVRFNLAIMLLRLGRIDEGKRLLNEVLSLDPSFGPAQSALRQLAGEPDKK